MITINFMDCYIAFLLPFLAFLDRMQSTIVGKGLVAVVPYVTPLDVRVIIIMHFYVYFNFATHLIKIVPKI